MKWDILYLELCNFIFSWVHFNDSGCSGIIYKILNPIGEWVNGREKISDKHNLLD